jgi:predicted nucleotide-binding protein (sugar kinase/HSP70/actin superfamily)
MFLRDLAKTKTVLDIRQLEKTYGKKMEQLETNKPEQPIRVVMVGELYVLMEPFSNFFLEKELAKRNIEVHRHCTASSILHDFLDARKLPQYVKKAHPYLTEQIGGHGTQSVAYVLEHAREGFDGAIHIKPFGCMPEVNAMPALYNISKDYQFPIIYFSFDSLTSETGIKTRIEAFHDMLLVKRQKYGTGKN